MDIDLLNEINIEASQYDSEVVTKSEPNDSWLEEAVVF